MSGGLFDKPRFCAVLDSVCQAYPAGGTPAERLGLDVEGADRVLALMVDAHVLNTAYRYHEDQRELKAAGGLVGRRYSKEEFHELARQRAAEFDALAAIVDGKG